MIQQETFETKTGFDKIRELLKNHCSSQLGKDKVDEIDFSTNFDTIISLLNQTHEFTKIIEEEDFPSDPFYDVRGGLKRIETEGFYLWTSSGTSKTTPPQNWPPSAGAFP